MKAKLSVDGQVKEPLTSSGSSSSLACQVAERVRDTGSVLVIGGVVPFVRELARRAQEVEVWDKNPEQQDILLRQLADWDIGNVKITLGNGLSRKPDRMFDCILVACRMAREPTELLDSVSDSGWLFSFVGPHKVRQDLVGYHKQGDKHHREVLGARQFVTDFSAVLLALGYIESSQLSVLEKEQERTGKSAEALAKEMFFLSGDDIIRALAAQRGLRLYSYDELRTRYDTTLADKVSVSYLKFNKVIPVAIEDGVLTAASAGLDVDTASLAKAFGVMQVELVMVTPNVFRRFSEEFGHHVNNAHKPKQEDPSTNTSLDEVLRTAVSSRASDIHFECGEEGTRARLRIDGDLFWHDAPALKTEQYLAIVNLLKVQGGLDIAERRRPQGATVRYVTSGQEFEMRMQFQRTMYGENLVLRLQGARQRVFAVDELGLLPEVTDAYLELLDAPGGIVLITGPTGSGKSATLYAGLQKLARDARRKVISVEDPVEVLVKGIQQCEVDTAIGFTFDQAMRSFVRQDPDVIVVGEIRDSETALEAIRASQTGHLVMSTLHCSDATDAVQRLVDLGMHPNSIASELRAVFAQRLAKRVCKFCATPDPEGKERLEVACQTKLDDFQPQTGPGCHNCRGTGTHGRIAVAEYLPTLQDIRIAMSKAVAVDELRQLSLHHGLLTLKHSIMTLVGKGVVPVSEAFRLLSAERLRETMFT